MNALQAGNRVPAFPGATRVTANFIGFQAGWLACVLGAAHGWPWAGIAIAAGVVALHLRAAARPALELKLIAVALLTGLLWDSLLASLGVIAFASETPVDGLAPPWILAMWALFATTLNVSLRWLHGHWLIAALLGCAAGPLSYWAGARLGAVVLVEPVPALALLCVGWAAMTPLLLALARRYDGALATS